MSSIEVFERNVINNVPTPAEGSVFAYPSRDGGVVLFFGTEDGADSIELTTEEARALAWGLSVAADNVDAADLLAP